MTRQLFIHHVENVQEALRRFLNALCCGDSALADDLAQDSLMKAYMSLSSFNDESKFSTWIFSIAYNTFISHKRSHRFHDDLSEAASFATGERSDEAFRYQDLHLALSKLSELERGAILLHYLEGYSSAEIAKITDSTEATVRQRLSRGRAHLKELLSL